MSVSTVTDLLSVLTIIAQAMIIGLIGIFIYRVIIKKTNRFFDWLSDQGLLFGWIVALVATLGSLYLSEIALFAPCKLCWFQRIFMYPQVIILGIALFKRQKPAALYGIVLSAIGSLFSAYHYYIQVLSPRLAPCSVNDPVSCTEKAVIHYGYITIPLMCLTAFILIILFLAGVYRRQNENSPLADIP